MLSVAAVAPPGAAETGTAARRLIFPATRIASSRELTPPRVAGAQSSYGPFAIVIGLLFWFFLLAQITIYRAELNMVLAYRLWPRGLKRVVQGKADTDADVRAYSHYPKREQQATNIQVSVDVVDQDDQHSDSKNQTGGGSDECSTFQ